MRLHHTIHNFKEKNEVRKIHVHVYTVINNKFAHFSENWL